MADIHAGVTSATRRNASKADKKHPPFRHVMACLTPSPDAGRVLEHAVAFAELCGATLTALRVLQPRPPETALADPVEWDLARSEAVAWLQHLGEEVGASDDIRYTVVDGAPAKCICQAAREADADLAVIGTRDPGGSSIWGLGATARQVAEHFPGSVMIVPPKAGPRPPDSGGQPRILALLDGSPDAEAACSVAASLAARQGAELVLLHAVPQVSVTLQEPPAPEDAALRGELQHRAERAARERLERIRRLIPAADTRSRVTILSGEDPRRALARAVMEEDGDLVVLAARGLGNDPDLRIGSTAEYLIARTVTPALLFRPSDRAAHRVAGAAPERQPAVRGTG